MKPRMSWRALTGWILCCALTAVRAAPTEIRIASAYGPDNFQTQNLQQFADEVNRAGGGQLALKLHPGGTLLKPAEIFSGVRAGKAEAGEVIMSSLAREYGLFGIDSLPFIVSGYDDARRMWQVSRPAIERALHGRGLQLLYAVPWPPQNLYSKREIASVRDFKGLSMRNYNPATERIAELVGARPVKIEVVDLEQAIAADKLDLMITSSWTGVDTKAWTRLNHYYKVNAWIPKNMVFIDKKLFDGLAPDLRNKMLEAAAAAELRGWKLSQESDRNFERQLAENKVSVAAIDFSLRSYLDRIGETLAREWLKKAGNEELSVLLRYTTERSMK